MRTRKTVPLFAFKQAIPISSLFHRTFYFSHIVQEASWETKKNKQTKEKAKVVAAVIFGGRTWNAALAIYQQGWFEEKFLSKHTHFGRGVGWCGVNKMIIHFSEASICTAKRPFFY